jgi:hypothetical protein
MFGFRDEAALGVSSRWRSRHAAVGAEFDAFVGPHDYRG